MGISGGYLPEGIGYLGGYIRFRSIGKSTAPKGALPDFVGTLSAIRLCLPFWLADEVRTSSSLIIGVPSPIPKLYIRENHRGELALPRGGKTSQASEAGGIAP